MIRRTYDETCPNCGALIYGLLALMSRHRAGVKIDCPSCRAALTVSIVARSFSVNHNGIVIQWEMTGDGESV